MSWRAAFVIDFASAPTNLQDAAVHKGGWSESMWWDYNNAPTVTGPAWAQKRATLLPRTCRIVGMRLQQFTLVDGQFVAGATSALGIGVSGNSYWDPDLPQVSLSLKASSAGAGNVRRFNLRGVPDAQMSGGEYQPATTYKTLMTQFLDLMTSQGWSFPGKNLANASLPIIGIDAGVLKVLNAAGLQAGNWLRFLKVRDITGKLISGRWQILSIAGNSITLAGFDPTIAVGHVGKVRKEEYSLKVITDIQIGRAAVKKIGRPSEGYRGRRSKRR
jgi:hypothetical protein